MMKKVYVLIIDYKSEGVIVYGVYQCPTTAVCALGELLESDTSCFDYKWALRKMDDLNLTGRTKEEMNNTDYFIFEKTLE